MIESIRVSRALAADMVSNKLNDLHLPGVDNSIDKTSLGLANVYDTIKALPIILLDLVAFLSALYFLYGTLLYIISYGNDAKTAKAKQTMIWAIIGLAIAMLARYGAQYIAAIFKVKIPV